MSTLSQVATGDFANKAVLAVIVAALGFASALIVDLLKARRKPRMQLSWDADLDVGTIAVRPDIRKKVSILYNDDQITTLAALQCRIANTGNKVVKGHQLRFSFGPDVRLLEAYLDPSPEPELQVEETDESRSKTNQRIYRIGHLEKQQEVTFRFVLDGQPPRDWQPHPFNVQGDVAFVRRDISRIREDQEHIQPFLIYLLLLMLIPPLFQDLLSSVSSLAAAGLGLVFLLLLAPHIGPTSRVIARILTLLASTRPRGHQATIYVHGGRGVPNLLLAQDATIYGGVDLHTLGNDQDNEEVERTREDAAAE